MRNERKRSIREPEAPFGGKPIGPPIAGERTLAEKEVREIVATTIALLPTLSEAVFENTLSSVQAEALSRYGDDPRGTDRERGEAAADGEPGLSGMSDQSLVREVEKNLKAITKLRERLLPMGQASEGLNARDVTSFVTASTSAYERLVKFRDRIINQSRLAAMERAVVTVLRDADPEFATHLVDQMEEELRKIN